jgi:GNAT superfamily N-acetyltransferase
VRLREISPPHYARDVLPLTARLWAGRRTFEQYVAQTLELAQSSYGRRYFRTIGLYDGARLMSSFKRYERAIRIGSRRLRVLGFGAVFTPAEFRGRGYASLMLASALDFARASGYDAAYLFSDIRPQFYAELGFRELPSRRRKFRADTLDAKRLEIEAMTAADFAGMRRCFDACEGLRDVAFLRSRSLWDWVMLRNQHGSEHLAGQITNLLVRRRGNIRAYVVGVRQPERDAYVVDEYAFADTDGAAAIPALLRAAAGDLRSIAGWLSPARVDESLPKGVVQKRKESIFMMAPLNPSGAELADLVARNTASDFCWATDHI